METQWLREARRAFCFWLIHTITFYITNNLGLRKHKASGVLSQGEDAWLGFFVCSFALKPCVRPLEAPTHTHWHYKENTGFHLNAPLETFTSFTANLFIVHHCDTELKTNCDVMLGTATLTRTHNCCILSHCQGHKKTTTALLTCIFCILKCMICNYI